MCIPEPNGEYPNHSTKGETAEEIAFSKCHGEQGSNPMIYSKMIDFSGEFSRKCYKLN